MCPDMDYDFDEVCESKPACFENDVLNEPYFCDEFVMEHPMRYVGGRFYTREGSVQDEEKIRQEIYWKLDAVVKTGMARKTTALLELLKLQLYCPELPVHEDRIHVANRVFHIGEW